MMDSSLSDPMTMQTDEDKQGYSVVQVLPTNGYPPDLFTEKNLARRTPLFCGYVGNSDQEHILKHPVQLSCGHRFCSGCMDLMRASHVRECRRCQQEQDMDDLEGLPLDPVISTIDYDQCVKDFIATRDVDKLMVKCPYNCGIEKDKVLRIKHLQNHMNGCVKKTVECNLCHEQMAIEQFEHHSKNECKERPVTCRYNCGADLRYKDLETHSLYCTAKPNLCMFCEKGMYFGEDKHMEECYCECPLGCKPGEKVKLMSHMADVSYLLAHLLSFLSSLTSLGAVKPLGGEVDNRILSTTEDSDRDKLITMGRLLQIDAKQAQTKDLITQQVLAASNEKDVDRVSLNVTKLLELVAQSIKPTQTLMECRGATKALSRDVEILSDFTQRYDELKDAIVAEETVTNSSIAEIDAKLKDQDERFEYQNALFEQYKWESQDGKFLWAVEDIEALREKCRNPSTPHIISPPFYTQRFGYKMCLKLWINGKGFGAGDHMSVELMLMKGDYDPILEWPFLYQVTFKLIDLRKQSRPNHHTWKSNPTTNKDDWSKQPVNVINDKGFGNDKFISHSDLFDTAKGYIRNQKMYIFCEVLQIVRSTPSTQWELKEQF